MNFRRSVIIAELWWPEVARHWKFLHFLRFFKNDPLRENFQNSVPEGFVATPIDVLCSNFVKFGRPKIGKVVRYLPDKKTKFRPTLQLSLLGGSRPKSVRTSPRKCTQNATHFIQIASLSAELYSNAWTPSKHAVKWIQYSAEAYLWANYGILLSDTVYSDLCVSA